MHQRLPWNENYLYKRIPITFVLPYTEHQIVFFFFWLSITCAQWLALNYRAEAYEKSLQWRLYGNFSTKIYLSTFSSFLAKNIRWNRYLTSVMAPKSIYLRCCLPSFSPADFYVSFLQSSLTTPTGAIRALVLSKICSTEIDFDIIDRLD